MRKSLMESDLRQNADVRRVKKDAETQVFSKLCTLQTQLVISRIWPEVAGNRRAG
jgi:hypothetical protein